MKAYCLALGALSAAIFGFVDLTAAAPILNTNPGSYRDWNDIDEVAIVRPFRMSSYKQVVVSRLDTQGVRLPPAEQTLIR